jgi:uncharacterized protein YbbK (DUF523 family)
MKIVSACLAGLKCDYKGGSRACPKVVELIKKGKAIPVCPEQLGGLTTPRTPAEQVGEKVMTKNGKDVTKEFLKGAKESLKLAKLINCREAILKSKSPSCGVGKINDGTFQGKLIKGDGIFTKLLKAEGIEVKTEEDFKC